LTHISRDKTHRIEKQNRRAGITRAHTTIRKKSVSQGFAHKGPQRQKTPTRLGAALLVVRYVFHTKTNQSNRRPLVCVLSFTTIDRSTDGCWSTLMASSGVRSIDRSIERLAVPVTNHSRRSRCWMMMTPPLNRPLLLPPITTLTGRHTHAHQRSHVVASNRRRRRRWRRRCSAPGPQRPQALHAACLVRKGSERGSASPCVGVGVSRSTHPLQASPLTPTCPSTYTPHNNPHTTLPKGAWRRAWR
jgi:hypothetical protein